MRGECANVFAPRAQRRHFDHQHIEAEEKVFAEAACGHGALEIGVRERDQTRVHAQRIGAAKALEAALFEHAQQLGLNAGSERGDFIENDRAALREFEAAGLRRDGAGERAFLVSEEFRLDELGWKAGAIDFQKWRVMARPLLVNPARELIFARAAFAGDENSRSRASHFAGEIEHALRCGARADPRQSLGGTRGLRRGGASWRSLRRLAACRA